ncbi:MAG: hypothetical protein JSS43_29640 [Proteobacteria bacterium]|nr:hypothetical protein [Pseudomonadota bacterium]
MPRDRTSAKVGWEFVEKIDRNLKAVAILAGSGLITIAGLLAGPAIAAAAIAATEATILSAAGTVSFAIDGRSACRG